MLGNPPLKNLDTITRDKISLLDRLTQKLKLMQQIDAIAKTLEHASREELAQRVSEIKNLENQIKRLGPC